MATEKLHRHIYKALVYKVKTIEICVWYKSNYIEQGHSQFSPKMACFMCIFCTEGECFLYDFSSMYVIICTQSK